MRGQQVDRSPLLDEMGVEVQWIGVSPQMSTTRRAMVFSESFPSPHACTIEKRMYESSNGGEILSAFGVYPPNGWYWSMCLI